MRDRVARYFNNLLFHSEEHESVVGVGAVAKSNVVVVDSHGDSGSSTIANDAISIWSTPAQLLSLRLVRNL